MNETGIVIAVEGETATVRMKPSPACARCGLCLRIADTGEMQITVRSECAASVNDRVFVEFKPESFLKAAAVLYGLPLCGFLLGGGAGALISPEPWVICLCGLAAAVLIFGVIKHNEPKLVKKKHMAIATRKI